MNLKDFQRVYFIGIGGIGMSALARYFNMLGMEVCGYDKTASPLTDELENEGMKLNFNDEIKSAGEEVLDETKKSKTLIVYTPAIPKDHQQLKYFKENGFAVKKRAEVLGAITKDTFTIAIAGTHGKTTTSSLVAHIFKNSKRNFSAFLGGITVNYNTNFLAPYDPSAANIVTIVEADEYDRSFLTLHPDIAVITSMDPDHLDIYGEKKYLEESFNLFARQVHKDGRVFFRKGLPLEQLKGIKQETYSVSVPADFYAENIKVEEGHYTFDFVSSDFKINGINFRMPGRHNVENAVAATAAAYYAGISASEIKIALETFKGVKRRFEYIIDTPSLKFIDDYAHHPEELNACIKAVKEMYSDKKVTGIFQPHLYSRTRDFADGFAQSLDLLDECILLDIYPARELPMEGVSSEMIMSRMKINNKRVLTKEELQKEFEIRKPEVLLTLGAGDIDRMVEPLKQKLLR